MPYHRVIPVLLYDNGAVFRSQQFTRHYRLGDPLQQLNRYKLWDVDEIVYVDMHRHPGGRGLNEFLRDIALNCFAPLAVGGGIRTLDDIQHRLGAGADRVIINTAAIDDPSLLTKAAHRFGEQAIIVSIDAKRWQDGRYEVIAESGRRPTGRIVHEWAMEAAARGAGEIFLNSIDRDGMGLGYDIDLIRNITHRVSVPVIACGGVGAFEHLISGIRDGGASSVAAANIFCFKELSYLLAKDALSAAGIPVRPSDTAPKHRAHRSGAAS
jgi:imidazoleglycerol phosphate synthase cyclase subunit